MQEAYANLFINIPPCSKHSETKHSFIEYFFLNALPPMLHVDLLYSQENNAISIYQLLYQHPSLLQIQCAKTLIHRALHPQCTSTYAPCVSLIVVHKHMNHHFNLCACLSSTGHSLYQQFHKNGSQHQTTLVGEFRSTQL
jgi:hypothetical protein